MAVIFDLDQTIINSQNVAHLRKSRRWNEVYQGIPNMELYEGIGDLISLLNTNNISTSVVTSSPKPYCERVINYWDVGIKICVCYHDTERRKPNPDPLILAAHKMGVDIKDTVSIGDHPNDIIAAKAAGAVSIAVLWGAEDKESLKNANPDYIFSSVRELNCFLVDRYRLRTVV